MPTAGGLNRLPQERLDELLDGIGAAIDDAGRAFTMTYAAVTVTVARGGAA